MFQEFVEGALEGVGRELDGGTVVTEIDDHGLFFEGVCLAVEDAIGIFEDDRNGSPFMWWQDDRFEAFDVGPGDITGGEAAGVVCEAVVVDDEAGAIPDDLAEVEGTQEETDGGDEAEEDENEDG
jgi:hypothetical protein